MNVKHIALIDDSSIFCFIFQKLVEKYEKCKVEVMVFDNGKSAFDYFANKDNQVIVYPHLIFVDINMPILNGWGFLDALRDGNMALIDEAVFFILSSSDNDVDINKSKEYSFVKEYLHKPLDKNKLFSILDQHLNI